MDRRRTKWRGRLRKEIKTMAISQGLLAEFDHEMANTRKVLERVPDDKLGWKPHEKSMTMGRLAQHVAEMAEWAAMTVQTDELDIAPVGQPPYQPANVESRQQILDMFDGKVKSARAAIEGATDENWMKTWSLLAGGK